MLIVLFSITVEMVKLRYRSLRCTGHVNNLSYSDIRWKWSNYDIGPYGVQGMLIICLIKSDGGNGRTSILVILAPTVYRVYYVLLTMITKGWFYQVGYHGSIISEIIDPIFTDLI